MSTDALMAAVLIVSAGNLLGLVLLWRNFASALDEKRSHGERLSTLETKITYLPAHRDLVEIRQALNALTNTVAGLDERSEATSDMLRTIQEYLLEQRK